MADSTRRSGRATKGQHSKNNEAEASAPAPAPAKRGGRGKRKTDEPPPEEVEPEAIIRCICGYIEEVEGDTRAMICCDTCEAWQHNVCMGLSDDEDELPSAYFCERCRPEDHKETLAKMKRGEEAWVERAEQREREEEEEKKNRKGRGKKGKRGRPSAAKKDGAETNGTANDTLDASQLEEASEEKPPVIERNKRKLPDQDKSEAKETAQAEPPSKTRKVSSPPPKPSTTTSSRRRSGAPTPQAARRDSTTFQLQTELVEDIQDLLNDDRKAAATALVRLLVNETKKAEKAGSFGLPAGQSEDDFGLRLGLSVEYALYLNFWGNSNKPSEQYSDKFRAILFNVKNNPLLRDRLLSGALSPDELSKMSRDDMASKELQDKKAEMLKEAEKQHTLIQDEGPRIRRTHKGEELVDDQSHVADGSQPAFSAPIRKRPSDINTSMKDASPEPYSAVTNVADEDIPEAPPSPPAAEPLPSNDQASPPQSSGLERSSTTKFDINDVYSQIKGPDTEQQRAYKPAPEAPAPAPAQKADADVDRLLKDEELEDEEPYSPKEFSSETAPGVVWTGDLGMSAVATFKGRAKHCAGADLSSSIPWRELIPATLGIQGRIDVDRARDYLCGLKWSTTTDLVVVSVSPESESDRPQFDKLFRYFTDRNRYGVINKLQTFNRAIRDIYLIPLEAGSTQKPEFIELLDVCHLENPTTERLLLLSFVVKLGNSPSSQQTPRHPDIAALASPISSAPTGSTPSLGSHSGFQNNQHSNVPYNGSAYPQYAGSPLSNQPNYTPPQNMSQQSGFAPPNQAPPAPFGMEAARFVLGGWANSSSVTALLAEAPRTSVQEFHVIKGLLEQNPAAHNDYNVLKDTMSRRLHSG